MTAPPRISGQNDLIDVDLAKSDVLQTMRSTARERSFNYFKTLVKLGASVGIIAYLIKRFHLHLDSIHIEHPHYLALVAILLLIQPFIMVVRWQRILTCFGHTLSYAKLTTILFISLFLNQFLPAAVGGDAVRIWYGRKEGVSLATIAASVLMDRVCALLGLLSMIAVLLPIAHRVIADQTVIAGLAMIVAAGAFGIALLMAMRPWTRMPKKSRLMAILTFPTNSIYTLCAQPSALFWAIALSVIVHVITAVCLYGIVYAVGEHLSVLQAMVLLPPITLAQMIPISIGGWGVREVAAVAALTSVGLDPTQSLGISLIFGLLFAFASMPGAAFWMLHRRKTQLNR